MEHIEKWMEKIYYLGVDYGIRLVYAIVVLIVGLLIIKLINKSINRIMEKGDFDPSLAPFVKSLVKIILKILLIISVLGMLGVEMTSFIAMLGAAGLAIGMALSGTLQNFAGGIIILMFKPFKVGDYIEAQGYAGSVETIQIFNTILKTPDNKIIIIPNGGLATGSMINYSVMSTRRVDFSFGIGYGDNIDKAKEVLRAVVDGDENVLKDPLPFIAVAELGDSSVNFVVRVWVNSAHYWDVHFAMCEKVKKAFDEAGISIPFPQRDVHLDRGNE